MRMFDLRAATRADLPQVRLLLSRYWESRVTEAVLERDGLGGRFRLVVDLYVVPECRGFGVAQPSPLYQKIAVGCPGVDCILGGKAFRAFSELSLSSMRDFVRNLP